MAIEIRPFTVTIPAGTAVSAKFTVSLAMPARVVSQIDVRVPPGPRGEVGFGVGSSGVIVVPFGGAAYIVTDDEPLTFVLENLIDSGGWQFFGYNTGAYDHTIRLYFHCDLIRGAGASTTTAPPDNGSLSSGGADTTGAGSPAGGTGTTPPPVTPPPVTPPPITPPPTTGIPLTLPPAVPLPPGVTPATAPAEPDTLLLAPAGSGQVWLLDDGDYTQLSAQDDVDALLAAGVPGAQISAATHQALYAASAVLLSIDLGTDVLTGILTVR